MRKAILDQWGGVVVDENSLLLSVIDGDNWGWVVTNFDQWVGWVVFEIHHVYLRVECSRC